MLNWFHLLVGLFLPACGYQGAAGLPMPVRMDMAAIIRPASPNTALAAPAGFSPAPDIVTRRYDVPPEKLAAALAQVAAGEERVFEQAAFPGQTHWVARSKLMNYPDLVTAQINPDGTLILWSRSVYGWGDMGVNRARLEHWLARLDAVLAGG
jgi:uncharacterized protein (DUF1499 family)